MSPMPAQSTIDSELQKTFAGIYDRADRLIRWMLIAHMVLAIGMAAFYETWLVTFSVGLSALGMFLVARWLLPCTFFTRCIAGVSMQMFVALHIYQLHGMSEQHFFFFTTWTAMIVYQDWRCMWPGTLLIIGQHILFAILHNSGVQLYFFEDSYVGIRKLAFHFGIALFQVFLCGYWAILLRRQTVATTEQKARLQHASAAAERAHKQKSMFVATVSHEIRTPLTGMLGMIELLQESEQGPKEREYLDLLNRSGEALMTILGDVLDSEKLEAGRIDFRDQPFDLHAALQDASRLMQRRAVDKGIALRLEVAEETPRWVRGDAGRLRQILLNLLSNAVKFTSVGEVRLKAGCRDPFAEPLLVEVHVEDTGIGMSAEELARLFHPFQQANEETTSRFGGTGLGLWISRGLAERMGGNLAATSEVGRGSTFTLTLPFERSRSDVARRRPSTKTEDKPHDALVGLRVLVAEDNPVNQKLLSAVLERAGCVVISATDGREAVDRHKDSAPDLILMDCHMPVLDGVEATREIRSAESDGRHTPIVALSADSILIERDRCLAAGMDEFCEKPIGQKSLLELLRRHSARRD